jgi:putative transposase
LTTDFCVKALKTALKSGEKPEIFNTDQGSQFTSNDFTKVLMSQEIPTESLPLHILHS